MWISSRIKKDYESEKTIEQNYYPSRTVLNVHMINLGSLRKYLWNDNKGKDKRDSIVNPPMVNNNGPSNNILPDISFYNCYLHCFLLIIGRLLTEKVVKFHFITFTQKEFFLFFYDICKDMIIIYKCLTLYLTWKLSQTIW